MTPNIKLAFMKAACTSLCRVKKHIGSPRTLKLKATSDSLESKFKRFFTESFSQNIPNFKFESSSFTYDHDDLNFSYRYTVIKEEYNLTSRPLTVEEKAYLSDYVISCRTYDALCFAFYKHMQDPSICQDATDHIRYISDTSAAVGAISEEDPDGYQSVINLIRAVYPHTRLSNPAILLFIKSAFACSNIHHSNQTFSVTNNLYEFAFGREGRKSIIFNLNMNYFNKADVECFTIFDNYPIYNRDDGAYFDDRDISVEKSSYYKHGESDENRINYNTSRFFTQINSFHSIISLDNRNNYSGPIQKVPLSTDHYCSNLVDNINEGFDSEYNQTYNLMFLRLKSLRDFISYFSGHDNPYIRIIDASLSNAVTSAADSERIQYFIESFNRTDYRRSTCIHFPTSAVNEHGRNVGKLLNCVSVNNVKITYVMKLFDVIPFATILSPKLLKNRILHHFEITGAEVPDVPDEVFDFENRNKNEQKDTH